MRVIAGKAKGRRLKAVPGDTTRPVTDRVKEAVFNILQPDLEGTTFLDLFAGTGAVGIEALSRGADRAVFVDRNARAVATVRDNLAATGLSDRAQVIREDSFRYLERTSECFDIVYVAPPQYLGMWEKALAALDREESPAGDLVVVQIHPKEYHGLDLSCFELEDERRYGSTMVLFYGRRTGVASECEEGTEGEDGQGHQPHGTLQ